MKELRNIKPSEIIEVQNMGKYIMDLIMGNRKKPFIQNGSIMITERLRQFYTWGASKFVYIMSNNNCYGLQFKVNGLKHKGRVRVFYNPATDYFDIELLRERKDEVVNSFEDVCFDELQYILHCNIERNDDPKL